ncbi:TetR/AcrR family transcriptional regulator [Streptomyces sp. AC495_CC817]|uniref:TetR/AcrR family transcriptional regulator n=1 Tax=Streptomyces sp. AC495_CC817 TaxID=2823900 RepID=UPI001C27EF74|nr:TetR/AcrR family transcriptional regulator [Streptomyces sp. AC495_CC817]
MEQRTRTRGRPSGLTGEELIAAAREVFLEKGYSGASMDEVARRARVSKSSLYREHPSKDALYAAVVHHWALAGRDAMSGPLAALVSSSDVRAGLIELAETMRRGILSAPVLEMRRLVTSEAVSQPDVARSYLEESWNTNIRNLATAMRRLAADGRLRVSDSEADAAAEQFTWLVIGAPLNAQLLGGEGSGPSASDAVDVFLARYRTA